MDDFQQAAAAARGHYSEETWTALPPRTQAEAIYSELRRIDAERVAVGALRHRSTARSGNEQPGERPMAMHAD